MTFHQGMDVKIFHADRIKVTTFPRLNLKFSGTFPDTKGLKSIGISRIHISNNIIDYQNRMVTL